MATGYGILPMWNYPSAFGDYTNYMPSMMGLPAAGGYGYGAGSIFGGYGMNPMTMMMEYPIYMQKLQNQLELENLNHTSRMHNGMINNEVKAHEESLSGVIQKLVTDGAAQEKLMTFYDKLREGDQKGAVQEYDKLKEVVYATFDKELESKGIHVNRADEARRIIKTMYNDVVTAAAGDGQRHTLEGDIEKYCSDAFASGFYNGYNNENGQMYRDELINHIYGERINNYKSKENRNSLGGYLGTGASYVVSGVEGAAIGGVAGLGAAGMIYGASRFFSPESGKNFRSKFWNAGDKVIYKNMAGKKISKRAAEKLAKKGEMYTKRILTGVKKPGWGKRMGKIGLAIGLITFIGREIINRNDK